MSRKDLPSPATLGLTRPTASQDLQDLGFNTQATLPILWSIAATDKPDHVLNTLVRLYSGLEDSQQLTQALIDNEALRIRLIALLGGSTALGDHLAANPQLWWELEKPLPDYEEMQQQLLSVIEAEPATFTEQVEDPATVELHTPGTYRAGIEEQDAKPLLKSTYRTLIMRVAAHDLAGTFYSRKGQTQPQPQVPFTQVTKLNTALADAALTAALALSVHMVYGDDELNMKLAVIAMGKCGAGELNYISDVDVIFVGEALGEEEERGMRKATRVAAEFNRIGSACFFEVDANLRPEGKSGALVRTLESHIHYYKRWAETWEFQAQLKLRPQTGNMALGQGYAEAIRPMVWEASQRDSFVEDIQAMRRRVLENVPESLKTRELKLGVGGLRDVEFAVQLLQLVHGRSDDNLRTLATVDALDALVAAGYVGRDDGNQLIEAYEFLRLLEHRLQLERFRRTHTMPADDDEEALSWLANVSGFVAQGSRSAVAMMNRHLKKIRLRISELHSRLFYRPLLNSVVSMSSAELKLTPEAAKLQLAALGYRAPDRAFEHLTALASGSTRKSRIQAILLPTLMEWLSDTADPDAGLLNYRKLSDAAFDRTWFLRMLRDEGIVGKRLMQILGTSPYTSDLIIAAPDVVKMLSDGSDGPKLLDTTPEQVSSALLNAAQRHRDPDKAVSVARSLRRQELARIAAGDLLGYLDVQQVCRELSTIWAAVLEASLRAEIRWWMHQEADRLEEAGEDSAPRPLARIAVIGMGRLGGMELGFGSDADVMVTAQPAPGVDEPEATKWAISIIDKMRTRLAKPSSDPPLDVDLGLRPEGRSGAIVRTIESYERYYSQWGEPWEIQALLRADFFAGDETVGKQFIEMINQFRYPENGVSQATIRDIRRMKARVDNERLPRGADRNTHTKLGRGGLSDVEWTVQLLTMMHAHKHPELHNPSTLGTLDALDETGVLPHEQVESLKEAWLMATDARNALVLVRGKRVDQLPTPGLQLAQVAGAAGWKPEENQYFLDAYLKATRHARRVVDEVFWGEAESFEHG